MGPHVDAPLSHTLAMRRLIRDAYDASAPAYARASWPVYGPLGVVLARAVRLRPTERALDLGTGAGAVARALGGRLVIGLDLSPAQLLNNPLPARVAADAEALPFRDEVFDVVVGGFWIGHFPDPIRALIAVHRVLVPGGRLGLSTWARPEEPYRPKEIVLAALARATGARRTAAGLEVERMTDAIGSASALARALEVAGFHEISVERIVRTLPWPGAEAFVDYRLSLLGAATLLDPRSSARLRSEAIGDLEALSEWERPWRVGVLVATSSRSRRSRGRPRHTPPLRE